MPFARPPTAESLVVHEAMRWPIPVVSTCHVVLSLTLYCDHSRRAQPGYMPPLGASPYTWPNIFKNMKRMDYCVDKFDFLGNREVILPYSYPCSP